MEPIPCPQDGPLLDNKLAKGDHPVDMEIAEKKWDPEMAPQSSHFHVHKVGPLGTKTVKIEIRVEIEMGPLRSHFGPTYI